MTIRLATPQAIYEVGGRSQNEDYIFPPLGKAKARGMWYLVCDGVGGASKGEVASRLLGEGLNQYFSDYSPIGPVTEEYLQAALSATEQQMEAYVTDHPEAEGMASTLTLLYLDEKGAVIAWIGDSRGYQFRQGECIYQTQDHSLVNQLVQQGVLTAEEAKNHPRSNVILRAVKGSNEPAELASHRIEDIQPQDVFLLCSDGLLEQWDTPELAALTDSGLSLANIRSTLLSKSEGQTSDNFSAYLVQVASVDGQKKARVGTTPPPPEAQQDRGWLGRALWGALIVGLIVLGLLFILSEDNEIRKQALAARMNGKQVEAVFWADSLTTLQVDDENKKMAKVLRDSLQSELFLWMSDSTNPQYHISYYGCGLAAEELQIWGDKRTTGTVFQLREECAALSA
ncbi:MAG: protein phosphatase 2C domain-containing protein, partial [Bacteroidota bacterium]